MDLNSIYIQYAEMLSSIINTEKELHDKKKVLKDLKDKFNSNECDGGYGVEISAHAFRQIAERLESLAMGSSVIYKDVFNPDNPSRSLLLPSNMKSFIITSLANARSKGLFQIEPSKDNGNEFRYTIDIRKWSGSKTLQFVSIVENNNVKTGFFNWV